MRIVLTKDDRIGVITDGGIADVTSVFEDIPYRTAADRMPKVIEALASRRGAIEEAASGKSAKLIKIEETTSGSHASKLIKIEETSAGLAARSTGSMPELNAPVPRPPKLIAAFGNYREGWDRERQPQDMFLESPDSVLAPNGTVVLPNHKADIFHHEAELALVIGKRSKDLPADESALDSLAGYTCAMDISARGLGRVGPSRIGKSFDTFTPLGPAIVTRDEVPDPQKLRVTLTVNGEERQNYTTADMEYSVVEILSFISGYMTLVPGDVILCGTQHQGLGAIQDGDHVEMTIESIGTLAVDVHDPQKREWSREIDEDMAARQRAVGRS